METDHAHGFNRRDGREEAPACTAGALVRSPHPTPPTKPDAHLSPWRRWMRRVEQGGEGGCAGPKKTSRSPKNAGPQTCRTQQAPSRFHAGVSLQRARRRGTREAASGHVRPHAPLQARGRRRLDACVSARRKTEGLGTHIELVWLALVPDFLALLPCFDRVGRRLVAEIGCLHQ